MYGELAHANRPPNSRSCQNPCWTALNTHLRPHTSSTREERGNGCGPHCVARGATRRASERMACRVRQGLGSLSGA